VAFAYTTGNPNDLTGGGNAEMIDIQGSFNDIKTYLNSGILDTLARSSMVIGEVRFIAVASTPALWLPANGAAVSRVTYLALFQAIGTVYGVGDGVNTFNVPDLAGRTAMGAGTGAGLTARTAGTKAGTEGISTAQLPAHAHTMTAAVKSEVPQVPVDANGGGAIQWVARWLNQVEVTSTNNAGSGAADGNLQPTLVVPAYIYAGV